MLGDRSDDLVTLMRDGDVLFRALVARRQSVHNLLVATSPLSSSSPGWSATPAPTSSRRWTTSSTVVDVLNKNQDNLDNSLRLMAPFYRVFANTLGNGPWFDTYIQNLPAACRTGRRADMAVSCRSCIVAAGAVDRGVVAASWRGHRAARPVTTKYLTASFPRTVSLYEGSTCGSSACRSARSSRSRRPAPTSPSRCGTTRSTTSPPTPRP